MLFWLYFLIVQCKKNPAEPKQTPEVYPLAVSTRQMERKNNFYCEPDDPDCPFDDLSNPDIINCGQRCWSDDGTAIFEYTFKGVQFVLYGKRAKDHGSFELYIDENEPEVIDEHIDSSTPDVYALLYTSDVLDYKEHKIVMKGTGKKFELFRLSYWPLLKVRRLNSTDFTSTGSWILESDENGGTRHYTNNIGARKSISIYGSKIWVYATEYEYHGIMNVKFDKLDKDIDTKGPVRKDGILLYESEELPFGLYNLDITCVTNDILIYCVYYLYDPPEQTKAPFPSRSLYPETDQTYINKQFTALTIPNDQIVVSVDSKIKQISGCTFLDITEDRNYFIRIDHEIPFFDNRIEFTAIREKMPAPIWANYAGSLTITGCTFIKCISRINEGNILTSKVATNVIFETCTFLNCGDRETQAIVKFYDPSASIKYFGCTFYFDIETVSCPAISGDSSNILIDRCTFTKCAAINIETNTNPANTKFFEFTNNVVTSSNQRVINVNSYLHKKPVISGNVFNKHNLVDSYFLVLRHDVNEDIEFYNNTFDQIVTSGDKTIYGGSCAIWVQTKNNQKGGLIFDKCKFTNNRNDWTKNPFNQGGAIQYGYTKTIANTSMKFISCEFKGNKCTNGKGGSIAMSVNYDLEINDCTFDTNIASDKGGAIYIWGKIVENNQQINEELKMKSITIINCRFNSNKGSNGNAIFIEQDNIEKVKLDISKCSFTNNGDTISSSMIVSYCGEVIFEDNVVQYSDKSKSSAPLNLNVPRSLTLINNSFTNCASSASSSVILSGQNENSITTIKKCTFVDCKASGFTIIITAGSAEVEDCSVSFTSNNQNSACGCIKFQTKGLSCKYSTFSKSYSSGAITYIQTTNQKDPILVTNCVFEDTNGGNTRCFAIKSNTDDVTFSNNIIQKMKQTGNSGYFGQIEFITKTNNLVLDNITFQDNSCNCDYGGGTGLWLKLMDTITFNNCKFINNAALKSPDPRGKLPSQKYYTGDGGGIQYGFSDSIYDVNMIFTKCTFTRNKAVRHGGAIALQTVKKVEIVECTFNENVANYKDKSSYQLLEFNNYFNLKEEGRGGALYFNPVFKHKDHNPDTNKKFMTDVKIEGCTFNSNSAFDGYAIYIEGDDPGTKFVINNNKFTNNYDKVNNDMTRGIITSEINNLYENKIVDSNTFDPYPQNQKQFKVVYVDNSGRTPAATPMPTISSTEFGDSQCNPRCYHVVADPKFPECINVTKQLFEGITNDTESGGAIHFVNSGLNIINSRFFDCKTTAGGGGAIYVSNHMLIENNIIIKDVTFEQCKSYYGGAVYIYSVSEYDIVLIKNCTFISNQLIEGDNKDNLHGGSAVYLHSRNGEVQNCAFSFNKGKGGSLKIVNDFDSNDAKLILLNQQNYLVVSDCVFDNDDVHSSTIFYVGGNSKSSLEVSNCEFKGLNINRYIDGLQLVNEKPKISIKSCSFDGKIKKSLNLDNDDKLIKLEKKFNDSFNVESNVKDNSHVYLAVVPVLAVFAVLAIVLVVKKNRQYQQQSENEEEEL